MSATEVTRADSDRDLPDTWAGQTARRVLDHLVAITDEHGIASASMRELGGALDIGAATARRAIALLRGRGLVVVLLRGTGGSYSSRYRVRADLLLRDDIRAIA